MMKIGAGGHERVSHIERTKAGVAAATDSQPHASERDVVAHDQARNVGLIRIVVPAQREDDIGSVGRIDSDLIEGKRAGHRLLRQDDAREIPLLKELDDFSGKFLVVADDVQQDRGAVAHDHDIAILRRLLELARGRKTRPVQQIGDIHRADDG